MLVFVVSAQKLESSFQGLSHLAQDLLSYLRFQSHVALINHFHSAAS